ncbi:hypothetical protein HMPREF0591_4808 [Mycobacterium parascrofulaceum ATCC BAA-614]|uniref:Uncharacterized protein n=1 Tax=Mycobacterium parascrofulaceum ATCC BAA-614 TaxID=525368 RepID=D5PF64_9MYCO|nr:hypothetical protein [Mycobacterium parascrofulaceum]EFG75245.1 hypothetical protein HMPREF0591_4808 [Mycobacterium parascrofulaceum ATCC BAA-614]
MATVSESKKTKSSAAKAREAEAADDCVVIEQCGVTLHVPVHNVPIDAMEAARAGDDYGATKALLGEEQWNALRGAGAGSRDLRELGDKIRAATQGN